MSDSKRSEPIEIKIIDTIENGKPDDLFICAGSSEKRCLGAIRILEKNYKANAIFLLEYSHKNESREKHLEEMRDILKNVGNISNFVINEEAPIPMVNEIVLKLEEFVADKKNPKITIDISTFIKWHLLVFLKTLDLKGLLHKCRFLYTEPKDYIIDLFQPLSFGIKEIFPIPLYSGNFDFTRDCLLVIMLGYEGDRAMGLLENIDPSECLLLVPKPAYHAEWEGRTEEMNKEIINIVGLSNVKFIDSRNPVAVAEKMHEILSDARYSKYNIFISPMGTKPQTFGLHLYWSRHSDNTTLIYGAPLRHNDLFYSEGIGPTWMLPTE